GNGVSMSGGADADSLVNTGGTNITMSGDAGNDTLVSTDGINVNMSGGADSDLLNLTDNTPTSDNSVDTLSGGAGNDTYVFVGNSPGSVLINESSADAGTNTLDFSNFTGGPITLDLALTTAQPVGSIPGNSVT